MEVNDHTLTEILRLTQDNNKILRSMRRHAFWGGILKIIIYFILFVAIPFWAYMTYLAPIVESMQETMRQVQGTGAQAQAQFSDFEKMWNEFRSKFPGSGAQE